MRALDLAVLLVYVVGVTAFGAAFYRRARTPKGFTSADGRLPSWAVGLSIFGTYLSSISFLALPGNSYGGNWNAFVFSLSLPLAAWAAARWFAPLYRASGDISAYAYLERRFGVWARLYAMTFYILTQIARMGTIMFLMALALQRLTGWDLIPVILASGVLVTFYTLVGGIEAVIWTDVVQSVVLTVGALVCAGLLLFDTPGGPTHLFAYANAASKFSLGSFAFDFKHSTVWVVLLYGVVINLQNFGIDQSYIQRYQAARSVGAARGSIWIGALMYIPVSALFLFIGTALFSFYGTQPNLLPAALHASSMNDRVFPYFMTTALPPGTTGLMIAALAAAAMSSISTSINSPATVLLSDVYRRFLAPGADHARQMRFLHLATLVLGIVGTGTALMMISIQHALDAWWRISGIFSGGMLGLFLLGAFSRRTHAAQAGAGMVVGLVAIIWATFSHGIQAPWANGLDALMTTVVGTLAIFVVGLVLSRTQRRRARATPPETVYDLAGD